MHALLDRLDQREFRLILVGFALLIVAGSFSYVAVPQWKAFSAANTRLQTLQALPPAGDVTMQLQGMRDMVAGLRRVVQGEAGTLPARELEAYLIGKLQAISWSNDVELAGVRPGERRKVRGFWETTFKVEVSGNYEALYGWLSEIAQQLGYIVIKEFQLSPRGSNPNEPVLHATMTIASYQSSQ